MLISSETLINKYSNPTVLTYPNVRLKIFPMHIDRVLCSQAEANPLKHVFFLKKQVLFHKSEAHREKKVSCLSFLFYLITHYAGCIYSMIISFIMEILL